MSTQSGRTRMGNYEMGRTLDLGSISKVKFARNMETGEGVAIKVLDKEKVLQHNMVDQIKREISAMKFISHPNVIQLHEVMASKTKIYLVLEFAAGGQLFDKLIGHGRLREDEARRYFQQLINAVDYCHSCGVYHRNLKPENLLLDAYGNLKVSGFGLSALPQQVRKDGLLHTTCGTPNYVAPEVINDKGYDGASADLWSCGVILYVMVSGCFPFDESNIINLYRKINKAEFTCPSWLSSSVKELITRILDPNPKTRITMPEILENEWFKKGYEPPDFQEADGVNIDDVAVIFNDSQEHLVPENKEPQPVLKNAFELITMLQGVNLGNLFEKQTDIIKRETRFTSKHPAKEIIAKIEEAARPFGFDVQKENYKMRLQSAKAGRKGHLSIATEVFEVAAPLVMVELRKAGGDTLEFQEFCENISPQLEDIVWKPEEDTKESRHNC